MPGEQNFKVYLSFKDDATGKFVKATEDQINSMKKLGLTIKKEGAGAAVDLDKMATAHDKAGRAGRFHREEIGKLAGTIGSLRNMILVWMFALRPLIALFKETTEAMIKQEDAINRINYAMGLQGSYSKEMSDYLIRLSESFRDVTRYGDEAVLEVMEKLITIGSVMPSQLERVTQAVLDLSAATGRDLATSAEILAKSSQGITRGLAQVGIVIDKNIPKTKLLEEVLGYVEKHMGGRAQADVSSYAGKTAQLTNAFDDLKEAIGITLRAWIDYDKIIKSLTNASKLGTAILTGKTSEIDKLKSELVIINKLIEEAKKPIEIKFLGIKIPALGILKDITENIKNTVELEIKLVNITNKINKIGTEERIKQEMIDIKVGGEKINQDKLALQETFEEQYLTYQRTKASFRLKELNTEYAAYKSVYMNNAKVLLEVDEWYKYQKEILDIEILKQAKIHSDMYVQFMQGAARGMKEALVDGFIKIAKGEFEGLKDVVINFGNVMLEVLAQMAAMKILKATGMAAFLGAHTGGYIMSSLDSFGYRKKFHSGGEVPATLLEGEGVVNRAGMRSLGVDNLNKLNRGEGAGGGNTINNYYIDAIDAKSLRERLQEHGDIYSSASESAIRDNGSLRRTTQRYGR